MYLRLAPQDAVERIYRRLYRAGRPLAGARTNAETAREFMARLTTKLNEVQRHSYFQKALALAEQEVLFLTKLYERTLFADHAIPKNDAVTALILWKRLRLRLMLARMLTGTRRKLAPLLSVFTTHKESQY